MDASTIPFLSSEARALSSSIDEERPSPSSFFSHQEKLIPSTNTKAGSRKQLAQLLTTLLALWGVISIFIQISQIFIFSTSRSSQKYDVYRPSTLPPGLNNCTCGSTLAEAYAKNCTFSPLAAAWLPPHCTDTSLQIKFSHSGPGINKTWTYYSDNNGTAELSEKEMGELGEVGGSFWATREWHVSHCLFYWEKMVRMRETGVVMEARFEGVKHVGHCRALILQSLAGEKDGKGKGERGELVGVNVVMSSAGDDE